MPPGWQKCCDLGGVKNVRFGPALNDCPGNVGCGTGGQPPSSGDVGAAFTFSTQRPMSVYFGMETSPSPWRGTIREKWTLKAYNGATSADPEIRMPIMQPEWPLDWDPNFWRPLDPTVYVPPTVPYIQPDPPYRPWPGPDVGNDPGGEPVTDPLTPDIVATPDPTPRTRRVPRTRTHTDRGHVRRRPDGRTEHEGKYSASKTGFGRLAAILLRLAAGTYGGITEVIDLVSALYAALPDRLIAQQPDLPRDQILAHMLGTIWANRSQLDMQEALHNVAVNAVEDWAWGKYFQAIANVSRRGPYLEGYQRQLDQLNTEFMDVAKELGIDVPTDFVWWLR